MTSGGYATAGDWPSPLELLRRMRAVSSSVAAAGTPDAIAAAALVDGIGVLGASAVLVRIAGTRSGDQARAAAVASTAGARPGPRPGSLLGTAGDPELVAALAAAAGSVRLAPDAMPPTGVRGPLAAGGGFVTVPLRAGRRTLGVLTASLLRPLPEPDELAGEAAALHLAAVADLCARQLDSILERRRTAAHGTRLELALSAAQLGTFDWDAELNQIYWSDRAATIFGVERLTGSLDSFYRAVVDEDRDRVAATLERARDTAGEFAADFRIRRPDVTTRWVDCRGRFLAGGDGPAVRMLGTVLDVTEQRTAAQRLASQLEQLGDGFFTLDDDNRFGYLNSAAERLLGRSRDEVIGQRIDDIAAYALGTPWWEKVLEARATNRPTVIRDARSRDGSRFFESRIYPGPDGLGIYLAEVTEQVLARQERKRLASVRQRAIDRAIGVQAVSDALAGTVTVADVLEVMGGPASRAAEANSSTVSLVHPDGTLVIAGHTGYPASIAGLSLGTPLPWEGALGVAAKEGAFVVDNAAALLTRWPEYEEIIEAVGQNSWVFLPLVAGGTVLGAWALAYLDQRDLTEEELALLSTLAGQCAQALARARLYEAERDTAWTLQHALAPREVPTVDGLAIAVRYLPEAEAAVAGGDFYDLLQLDENTVGILIGDVSGHGVAVSATMALVRTALRAYAAEGHGPAAVVRLANAVLGELVPDVLVTCLYGCFDLRTGSLVMARAGHLPPLVASAHGTVRLLEVPGGLPLGVDPDDAPTEHTVVLADHETVVLFTDGLVEAGHDGLDNGLDRVIVAAAKCCDVADPVLRADVVVGALVQTLDGVVGGHRDDVTVLAFGRAPTAEAARPGPLVSATPAR